MAMRVATVDPEILAAAERLDADLIVMGSSAHGLRAALLGSVAREVIRSAKRPVLVTREMSQEAGGREQQESTDRTA